MKQRIGYNILTKVALTILSRNSFIRNNCPKQKPIWSLIKLLQKLDSDLVILFIRNSSFVELRKQSPRKVK